MFTCSSGCRWTGINRAHCSICHHTFNRVSLFARHRRYGHCVDPVECGFVQRQGQGFAYWGQSGGDYYERFIEPALSP